MWIITIQKLFGLDVQALGAQYGTRKHGLIMATQKAERLMSTQMGQKYTLWLESNHNGPQVIYSVLSAWLLGSTNHWEAVRLGLVIYIYYKLFPYPYPPADKILQSSWDLSQGYTAQGDRPEMGLCSWNANALWERLAPLCKTEVVVCRLLKIVYRT